MTLTPREKRVIDLAYDEARSHRHNYIGTEHLLAGLVRDEQCVAGQVLRALGVALDGLWAAASKMEVAQTDQTEPKRPIQTKADEVSDRSLLLAFLPKLTWGRQRYVIGEAIIALTLLDETQEAADLLVCLGIEADAIRMALDEEKAESHRDENARLGPSFGEFLAHADVERAALAHFRVQPEHFVLAVPACECYGKDVLERCGLELDDAREAIRPLYT